MTRAASRELLTGQRRVIMTTKTMMMIRARVLGNYPRTNQRDQEAQKHDRGRDILTFAQDTPPHSKRQPTNLTPKNVTPTQQNSGSSGNNTKSQNNHHWITPGSFLYRTYYNQPYRILWKNFETEDSSRKEEAEQEERLDGWELILGSKDEPQLGIDTDEDNEREEEGEDEGDDEEEGDLDEEETVNIRGRGHSNREFVQNLTMSSGSRTFGKNLFQKISKKMNSLSQRHHNRSFSAPQKNHRRLGLESIFHQKPSSSSSPSPSSEQFNEVNDQPGDKQITQNQETHNNQSLTINLPISPTLSDQAVISKPLNKFETVANILNLSILSVSPGVKFPLPYSLEQLLQIQCPEMKQGLQDDPKSIVERSRIGLSLMMKNNVSIEGFLRHQSIQFLLQRVVIDSYNQSIKRVENLDWNCWKYYDRHCSNLRNKTLKGILSGTLQEVILKLFKTLDLSDDLNTSENENEILVLTHNNSRISISLQEDKDCILLSAADELNSHIFVSSVIKTSRLYEVKFPKSIDFNLLELIKEDDCEEENNGEDVAQLRNEIEEFFDSLFDRVLMIDDLLGKYEERFEKTSTNSLDDSLERSLTKGDGTIESCEHLSQQYKVQDSDRISLDLPEPRVLIPFYAQEGHHALPADNSVIVRERELASVVAFTLSSGDYKRQFQSYQEPSRRPIYGAASKAHSYHLPTLNAPIDRPNTQTKRDFSLPILSSQAMLDATSPTFLQAQVNLLADKLFSDPDDELGKFGKNCDYSSQIGYRKPPRAGRSILSLKGLSNQRSFDMGSLRSLVSSRVTSPNPNYEVDPLAQAGQSVDIQDGEDRVLNELIKSSEPSSTALSSTLQQSSVPPAPVAALLSRTGRSDPSTVSISHMQTLGVVESSSKGKSQRIKLKSRSSHQSPNTILLSDRETSGTEEEGVGLGERWKLKKDELEESSIETLSDENENFLTEAEKTPPTNKLLNQANNGNSSHQGNLTTPNSTTSTPSSRLISPFQGFWKTSKGSGRHRIGSGTEGEEGDDEEELVVTEEEDQEDFVRKMKKTKTKADQEGETPHIKYKLDHGSKEISCTVWYADEFERLRRGLGLNEEELIKSLSRSKDYEPVGGKSRSKFIISKDSKFILKGLINDNYWNESERESLLELLPNYFNYLFKGQDDDEKDDEEKHENGHHPSYGCSGGMMVKILGYYSIKVKTKKNYEKEDLKEKQEEAEVSYNSDVDRSTVDHNLDKDKLNKTLDGEEEDYILMENIFFGKNIERKFDLKGISNRFCKENKKYDSDQEKLKFHTRKDGEGTKDAVDKGEKSIFEIHFGREIFEKNFTGWDGNWIAGFNLAKMIESKSKRVFKSYYYSNTNENNSMKNPKVSLATSSMATVKGRLYNNNNKSEDLVTILPPDLYENRLKKFVEKNFVSAPEKWSRMNKLKSEVVIKEDKNQPKTKNNNSKLESQKSFDDLSKSMINIKSGFKRDEKKDFDNHEELGSKNYFHEENDENYYSRLSPVF
ncbi:hypothetical protein BY996DRAFT_8688095 [Phakopsora pachyrhizi]|nr:hypothetical protein BY996DRAFT_8688095 [Phakopsora pachyrhizi]